MSAIYTTPFTPTYSPPSNLPDSPAAQLAGLLGSLVGAFIANYPAGDMQVALTRFQATRIIGPLIGSPIKALYSTAQIILGIALLVLFGPLSTLTNWGFLNRLAGTGGYHLALGVAGLVTSMINFANFGGTIAQNEFVIVPVSRLANLGNRAAQQNPAPAV